jgi:hypothetical protein
MISLTHDAPAFSVPGRSQLLPGGLHRSLPLTRRAHHGWLIQWRRTSVGTFEGLS